MCSSTIGSINVDAELITELGEGMIGLANGCICCSIRTDLIRAVLELAGRPNPPDQIVIESSGAADPAGIVKSFLHPDLWAIVQLDGVICVVDAEQTPTLTAGEADLAKRQVAGADLVVLNKVDLVDAPTLARAHEWIGAVRPGTQVFEAIQCSLPPEAFRAKGFIYAADRPGNRLILNLVGRRATLSPSGSWGTKTPQTRLIFISRHNAVS